MNIGLYDAELEAMPRKVFPNYALMKISAYHKLMGDQVAWWSPITSNCFDKIYASKIFDFTLDNPYLPAAAIRGGTGYKDIDLRQQLPQKIDAMFPDYSLYPACNYAVGYITRGCPNHCSWCVVPDKEGNIKPYRDWHQLVRTDSDKLVLMDNNILASDYGIAQLASMVDSGYKIDLNQGMDARLVTPEIAEVLSRLKWIRFLRFACDTLSQLDAIDNVMQLLQANSVKPYRVFVYVLVTKDIDDAVKRVEHLQKYPNINLYAQAERNQSKGIVPNARQLEFAQRFVHKGMYKHESWAQYLERYQGVTRLWKDF